MPYILFLFFFFVSSVKPYTSSIRICNGTLFDMRDRMCLQRSLYSNMQQQHQHQTKPTNIFEVYFPMLVSRSFTLCLCYFFASFLFFLFLCISFLLLLVLLFSLKKNSPLVSIVSLPFFFTF